jgi:transposase
MQGRVSQQPQLLSTINLEAFVPQNHLLRRVERVLNLSFIREMTEALYCKANGRPSIDPELFFRMMLIEYLYDISSDRQLCEQIQYNLAFRWYCKLSLEDAVPDHSSLTRIRDRLGEKTFHGIFERVLELCHKKGLVKGERIMMDGTFIRADASKESMVTKDQNNKTDYSAANAPHINNRTHVSKTDPEATLMGNQYDKKALRYKSHTAIDEDSRVVIDCHVTTGAVIEGTIFQNRVEQLLTTKECPIQEVTADRGYGSAENLEFLRTKGIRSFIPRFHSTSGDGAQVEGFSYHKDQDIYVCPEGHAMPPMTAPRSGDIWRGYRVTGGHCHRCPLAETCLPKTHKKKRARRINRHLYQEALEETASKEKTEEFKEKLRQRMWRMEGIFAEGKNYHGLSRAKYRGRAKVQIQAYLTFTVQNLKRLVVASSDLFESIWRELRQKMTAFLLEPKKNLVASFSL